MTKQIYVTTLFPFIESFSCRSLWTRSKVELLNIKSYSKHSSHALSFYLLRSSTMLRFQRVLHERDSMNGEQGGYIYTSCHFIKVCAVPLLIFNHVQNWLLSLMLFQFRLHQIICLSLFTFLSLFAAKIRKVYAGELGQEDFLTASPRRQYLQQCHEIGDPWPDYQGQVNINIFSQFLMCPCRRTWHRMAVPTVVHVQPWWLRGRAVVW